MRLPVEVAGGDGASRSVTVTLTEPVRSLWLQIHGLEYADEVSVRVNDGEWVALNNKSVAVGEPARSYGGIGGAISTIPMTLALADGAVVEGENRIAFRFNHTNGVVSGFRVLGFNFLRADGSRVLGPELFAQEDPNEWIAPLRDAASVAAGKNLWHEGALVANGLPKAAPIRAHCADCHTQDGRDLKYFNFSNESIVTRSKFHGLSDLEGQEIASYVRQLNVPNPGRPWNPPYQPGPGMDSKPVEDWAAGAGLAWVLDKEKLQERVAKLAGGVAVIKVGGATEVEVKEKKDRIDDALHATKAAVQDGIVPGGGVALIRAKQAIANLKGDNADQQAGINIVLRAMEEPLRCIVSNAGESADVVLAAVINGTGNYGYNAATEQYVDMLADGVIDPTKVAKTALVNASSVAGLLLTTDCAIFDLPKDPNNPQPQMPNMM